MRFFDDNDLADDDDGGAGGFAQFGQLGGFFRQLIDHGDAIQDVVGRVGQAFKKSGSMTVEYYKEVNDALDVTLRKSQELAKQKKWSETLQKGGGSKSAPVTERGLPSPRTGTRTQKSTGRHWGAMKDRASEVEEGFNEAWSTYNWLVSRMRGGESLKGDLGKEMSAFRKQLVEGLGETVNDLGADYNRIRESIKSSKGKTKVDKTDMGKMRSGIMKSIDAIDAVDREITDILERSGVRIDKVFAVRRNKSGERIHEGGVQSGAGVSRDTIRAKVSRVPQEAAAARLKQREKVERVGYVRHDPSGDTSYTGEGAAQDRYSGSVSVRTPSSKDAQGKFEDVKVTVNRIHDALAKKLGIAADQILEISSASSTKLGKALSAFNLKLEHEGKEYSVESLYQGSKVFEGGKQFKDLYGKKSADAKKDPRLKKSGKVEGFNLFGKKFDADSSNSFYHYLYMNALLQKVPDIKDKLKDYKAFTDVFSKPGRAVQAQSVAMAASLAEKGKLNKEFLSDPKNLMPQDSTSPLYSPGTYEEIRDRKRRSGPTKVEGSPHRSVFQWIREAIQGEGDSGGPLRKSFSGVKDVLSSRKLLASLVPDIIQKIQGADIYSKSTGAVEIKKLRTELTQLRKKFKVISASTPESVKKGAVGDMRGRIERQEAVYDLAQSEGKVFGVKRGVLLKKLETTFSAVSSKLASLSDPDVQRRTKDQFEDVSARLDNFTARREEQVTKFGGRSQLERKIEELTKKIQPFEQRADIVGVMDTRMSDLTRRISVLRGKPVKSEKDRARIQGAEDRIEELYQQRLPLELTKKETGEMKRLQQQRSSDQFRLDTLESLGDRISKLAVEKDELKSDMDPKHIARLEAMFKDLGFKISSVRSMKPLQGRVGQARVERERGTLDKLTAKLAQITGMEPGDLKRKMLGDVQERYSGVHKQYWAAKPKKGEMTDAQRITEIDKAESDIKKLSHQLSRVNKTEADYVRERIRANEDQRKRLGVRLAKQQSEGGAESTKRIADIDKKIAVIDKIGSQLSNLHTKLAREDPGEAEAVEYRFKTNRMQREKLEQSKLAAYGPGTQYTSQLISANVWKRGQLEKDLERFSGEGDTSIRERLTTRKKYLEDLRAGGSPEMARAESDEPGALRKIKQSEPVGGVTARRMGLETDKLKVNWIALNNELSSVKDSWNNFVTRIKSGGISKGEIVLQFSAIEDVIKGVRHQLDEFGVGFGQFENKLKSGGQLTPEIEKGFKELRGVVKGLGTDLNELEDFDGVRKLKAQIQATRGKKSVRRTGTMVGADFMARQGRDEHAEAEAQVPAPLKRVEGQTKRTRGAVTWVKESVRGGIESYAEGTPRGTQYLDYLNEVAEVTKDKLQAIVGSEAMLRGAMRSGVKDNKAYGKSLQDITDRGQRLIDFLVKYREQLGNVLQLLAAAGAGGGKFGRGIDPISGGAVNLPRRSTGDPGQYMHMADTALSPVEDPDSPLFKGTAFKNPKMAARIDQLLEQQVETYLENPDDPRTVRKRVTGKSLDDIHRTMSREFGSEYDVGSWYQDKSKLSYVTPTERSKEPGAPPVDIPSVIHGQVPEKLEEYYQEWTKKQERTRKKERAGEYVELGPQYDELEEVPLATHPAEQTRIMEYFRRVGRSLAKLDDVLERAYDSWAGVIVEGEEFQQLSAMRRGSKKRGGGGETPNYQKVNDELAEFMRLMYEAINTGEVLDDRLYRLGQTFGVAGDKLNVFVNDFVRGRRQIAEFANELTGIGKPLSGLPRQIAGTTGRLREGYESLMGSGVTPDATDAQRSRVVDPLRSAFQKGLFLEDKVEEIRGRAGSLTDRYRSGAMGEMGNFDRANFKADYERLRVEIEKLRPSINSVNQDVSQFNRNLLNSGVGPEKYSDYLRQIRDSMKAMGGEVDRLEAEVKGLDISKLPGVEEAKTKVKVLASSVDGLAEEAQEAVPIIQLLDDTIGTKKSLSKNLPIAARATNALAKAFEQLEAKAVGAYQQVRKVDNVLTTGVAGAAASTIDRVKNRLFSEQKGRVGRGFESVAEEAEFDERLAGEKSRYRDKKADNELSRLEKVDQAANQKFKAVEDTMRKPAADLVKVLDQLEDKALGVTRSFGRVDDALQGVSPLTPGSGSVKRVQARLQENADILKTMPLELQDAWRQMSAAGNEKVNEAWQAYTVPRFVGGVKGVGPKSPGEKYTIPGGFVGEGQDESVIDVRARYNDLLGLFEKARSKYGEGSQQVEDLGAKLRDAAFAKSRVGVARGESAGKDWWDQRSQSYEDWWQESMYEKERRPGYIKSMRQAPTKGMNFINSEDNQKRLTELRSAWGFVGEAVKDVGSSVAGVGERIDKVTGEIVSDFKNVDNSVDEVAGSTSVYADKVAELREKIKSLRKQMDLLQSGGGENTGAYKFARKEIGVHENELKGLFDKQKLLESDPSYRLREVRGAALEGASDKLGSGLGSILSAVKSSFSSDKVAQIAEDMGFSSLFTGLKDQTDQFGKGVTSLVKYMRSADFSTEEFDKRLKALKSTYGQTSPAIQKFIDQIDQLIKGLSESGMYTDEVKAEFNELRASLVSHLGVVDNIEESYRDLSGVMRSAAVGTDKVGDEIEETGKKAKAASRHVAGLTDKSRGMGGWGSKPGTGADDWSNIFGRRRGAAAGGGSGGPPPDDKKGVFDYLRGGFTRLGGRADQESESMGFGGGQGADGLTVWGVKAYASIQIAQRLVWWFRSLAERTIEFQLIMERVGGVTNTVGDEFERLTGFARKLGETTIFTATQAAEAMEELGRVGYSTSQILATLPEVLNVAAAEGIELAKAAKIVSANLKSFELHASSAGRLTNALAAASVSSAGTMEGFGVALRTVGTFAHTANVSIEETLAMLAKLADAGLTPRRAAVALRQMIQQLQKLERGGAEQELERIGLSMADIDPKIVGLSTAIRRLQERILSFGSDADRIFTLRGSQAFQILAQVGGESLESFTQSITGTTAAQRLAARQMETTHGSMKRMTSVFQELQISLGTGLEWAIRGVLDGLSSLMRVIIAMPGWLQTVIASVSGFGGMFLFAMQASMFFLYGQKLISDQGIRFTGILEKNITTLAKLKKVFITSAGSANVLGIALTALAVAVAATFYWRKRVADSEAKAAAKLRKDLHNEIQIRDRLLGKVREQETRTEDRVFDPSEQKQITETAKRVGNLTVEFNNLGNIVIKSRQDMDSLIASMRQGGLALDTLNKLVDARKQRDFSLFDFEEMLLMHEAADAIEGMTLSFNELGEAIFHMKEGFESSLDPATLFVDKLNELQFQQRGEQRMFQIQDADFRLRDVAQKFADVLFKEAKWDPGAMPYEQAAIGSEGLRAATGAYVPRGGEQAAFVEMIRRYAGARTEDNVFDISGFRTFVITAVLDEQKRVRQELRDYGPEGIRGRAIGNTELSRIEGGKYAHLFDEKVLGELFLGLTSAGETFSDAFGTTAKGGGDLAPVIRSRIMGPDQLRGLISSMERSQDYAKILEDLGVANRELKGTIDHVKDGDTLRVTLSDGSVESIRLKSVDTPEVYGGVEPMGTEASKFTEAWAKRVGDREVTIRETGEVHGGRSIAEMVGPGGEKLSEALLREGLGRVTPYMMKYGSEFVEDKLAIQLKSMIEGRGIWADTKDNRATWNINEEKTMDVIKELGITVEKLNSVVVKQVRGTMGYEGALAAILKTEGGYSPTDMNAAGQTFAVNRGITQGTWEEYRQWSGDGDLPADVKNLSGMNVENFYDWYFGVKGGVGDIPDWLKYSYMDFYTQAGGGAVAPLQERATEMGYGNLSPDGVWGPETREAVTAMLRDVDDIGEFVRWYFEERRKDLRGLDHQREAGMLKRIDAVEKHALSQSAFIGGASADELQIEEIASFVGGKRRPGIGGVAETPQLLDVLGYNQPYDEFGRVSGGPLARIEEAFVGARSYDDLVGSESLSEMQGAAENFIEKTELFRREAHTEATEKLLKDLEFLTQYVLPQVLHGMRMARGKEDRGEYKKLYGDFQSKFYDLLQKLDSSMESESAEVLSFEISQLTEGLTGKTVFAIREQLRVLKDMQSRISVESIGKEAYAKLLKDSESAQETLLTAMNSGLSEIASGWGEGFSESIQALFGNLEAKTSADIRVMVAKIANIGGQRIERLELQLKTMTGQLTDEFVGGMTDDQLKDYQKSIADLESNIAAKREELTGFIGKGRSMLVGRPLEDFRSVSYETSAGLVNATLDTFKTLSSEIVATKKDEHLSVDQKQGFILESKGVITGVLDHAKSQLSRITGDMSSEEFDVRLDMVDRVVVAARELLASFGDTLSEQAFSVLERYIVEWEKTLDLELNIGREKSTLAELAKDLSHLSSKQLEGNLVKVREMDFEVGEGGLTEDAVKQLQKEQSARIAELMAETINRAGSQFDRDIRKLKADSPTDTGVFVGRINRFLEEINLLEGSAANDMKLSDDDQRRTDEILGQSIIERWGVLKDAIVAQVDNILPADIDVDSIIGQSGLIGLKDALKTAESFGSISATEGELAAIKESLAALESVSSKVKSFATGWFSPQQAQQIIDSIDMDMAELPKFQDKISNALQVLMREDVVEGGMSLADVRTKYSDELSNLPDKGAGILVELGNIFAERMERIKAIYDRNMGALNLSSEADVLDYFSDYDMKDVQAHRNRLSDFRGELQKSGELLPKTANEINRMFAALGLVADSIKEGLESRDFDKDFRFREVGGYDKRARDNRKRSVKRQLRELGVQEKEEKAAVADRENKSKLRADITAKYARSRFELKSELDSDEDFQKAQNDVRKSLRGFGERFTDTFAPREAVFDEEGNQTGFEGPGDKIKDIFGAFMDIETDFDLSRHFDKLAQSFVRLEGVFTGFERQVDQTQSVFGFVNKTTGLTADKISSLGKGGDAAIGALLALPGALDAGLGLGGVLFGGAGAAVGGYFGGVQGAALGGGLGTQLYGAIANPDDLNSNINDTLDDQERLAGGRLNVRNTNVYINRVVNDIDAVLENKPDVTEFMDEFGLQIEQKLYDLTI